MVAVTQSPKFVSIFGDSWSLQTRDKSTSLFRSSLASIAVGLGSKGATNLSLYNYSVGGTSAFNAFKGDGGFATAVGGAAPFSAVAYEDDAQYQVFRYGINDVYFALAANPNQLTAAELASYGVDSSYNVVSASLWEARKAAFRTHMTTIFTSLCESSQAAGRKPVLVKMPRVATTPVQPTGWVWHARHAELMDIVYSVVSSVAAAKSVPVVDQSGTMLTTAQMADHIHPNTQYNHSIAYDLGARLAVILAAY